jgi:hypothetical protein
MLPKPNKLWNPQNWASWKPFGIGEQYPNNYWEVFRAIFENKEKIKLLAHCGKQFLLIPSVPKS